MTDTKTTRRSFMALAPAAALAPLSAGAMPSDTPPQDLPRWWDKLTGPSAATDPEVFYPWQDTQATREIAVKLEELRLLLLRHAPDGVNTVQFLNLHWNDDIPQSVHVSGRSGTYGEGLHMFRPEFGWVDKTPPTFLEG